MKKEVIIIAGANGTGKTTFARTFLKKYPFNFLNADEISRGLAGRQDWKRDFEAGEIFFHRIEALIKEDKNFVIESTLSGKYLLKLFQSVKAKGYSLTIIYIFLDNPDLCIERIKERVLKGGHSVPEREVMRRYYRSKENFWNLYKKYADKWYLIHNSRQQFVRIAMGIREKYVVKDSLIFDIFKKDVKI